MTREMVDHVYDMEPSRHEDLMRDAQQARLAARAHPQEDARIRNQVGFTAWLQTRLAVWGRGLGVRYGKAS